HRAPRALPVSLDELRGSRDAGDLLEDVIATEPPRRGCRRAVPAAVPPSQRGPLLREPESRSTAGRVGGFWQQRAALGRESPVDALPRQSRDRARQRRGG